MERKPIDQRIIDLLINGSPGARKMICEKEPMYFAIYYFPEYFNYSIPPFHFDFYDDIKDLSAFIINEAVWDAFRESAKTSIAKIALVCWAICYGKFNGYINWDAFDKGNAEQALFDITVALQTNKRIINDFGHLYFKKATKDAMSEAKMKRISSFITENDVKVEAFSTQESTRGRLYKNKRPGLFVVEDFETTKTKDSYPITHKVIQHIEEMRAGLSQSSAVLYLCNFITEEGSVAHVEEAVKRNPKGRVRRIPIEKAGEVAWPGKYTKTESAAVALNNEITDPTKYRISLEALEKRLGKSVYQSEMMLNPAHSGDKVFDRDRVEEMLKASKPPAREVAGLRIWHEFNPSHRYALGADTAKGVGKDSNASVIIDFSTNPCRVVATYKNNLIAPNIFAYEIKRQAEIFGLPLVAPENNNTGYATLTQLKQIYPLPRIYVPIQDDKVKEIIAPEYGFDTNAATKPEAVFQLKRAIEDGLLIAYDEDLLNEIKYYDQKALNTYKIVEGMTRHYDLLMACAICWMMKAHAKLSDVGKKPFKQGTYSPATEYGG
jgi:hypothetical protein